MTTTLRTNQPALAETAQQMTSGGRGILAADESIKTMSARLEKERIPASATTRRDYRELLLTADGLSESISGIILADETFGQQLDDGRAFPDAARELGILPGIKVDTGTTPLPGRQVRSSPKGSTPGWRRMPSAALPSPSGGQCSTYTRSPRTPRGQTATRWQGTRRCARSTGSCRSSSRRSCATATTTS
jgi:hypothetical protein